MNSVWRVFKQAGLIAVLFSLSVFGATPASADPASAEGEAAVQPAVADLTAQLGKPAELKVKTVNVVGEWAFVYGAIRGQGGGGFDYTGTPFAEAAANGGKSKVYAGLFRDRGNAWTRVDSAVGPTDVAWDGWAAKYGAPEEIFELPAD